MTFFEQKEQAKKDGMEVTSTTKKADITAFYAGKEPVYLTDKGEALDVTSEPTAEELKAKVEALEAEAKCTHFYEFVTMQAVRGAAPIDGDGKILRNAEGKELRGTRSYKDKYVCKLCNEVELRDSENMFKKAK